jgi:hypothetical protein
VKVSPLIFISIVIAYVFGEYLKLIAENHPWRVGVPVALAALIGAALWFLAGRTTWVIVTATFILGSVYGLVAGLDARDHDLGDYCKYGAQSQAQLDGCMGHVTTDDIDRLHTPAARFARGETSECGRGSGPYCAEAAKSNAD